MEGTTTMYLQTKRYRDNEDYDMIRMENQNKTILELQKEIEEYKKRERAFLVHLHLKDKEIKFHQSTIKDLEKKLNDKENRSEMYLDPLLMKEFKNLKALIKEKDQKLLAKEEELSTLQVTQNKYFYN